MGFLNQHYGKIAVAVVVITFCWEIHVANQDTKVRFTYLLEILAHYIMRFWYLLGRAYGIFCEFVKDVIWERLAIVMHRFWSPTVDILFSWLELFRGVKDYIMEVKLPSGVVFTCDFLVVGLIVLLIWYFGGFSWMYGKLPNIAPVTNPNGSIRS